MAVIEAIATSYLEADYASVTFSGIPGTYEHLQLRISAKSDRTSATNDDIELTFNGTTTPYCHHRMTGQDATPADDDTASDTFIKVSSIQSAAVASGAANYGSVIVDIFDYADDGNRGTTVVGLSGVNQAKPQDIGRNRVSFFTGLWSNLDDVTSIALVPSGGSNFVRGSEFTLYGIQE